MSSTKVSDLEEQLFGAAADLFLPIISGLTDAGENCTAQLCHIAMKQGLSSKGMAVVIWTLHLFKRPLKVSELAQSIACDTGNTSGLLDRLEEANLVERIHSNGDKRVRLIQLTTKGRKVGSQMESDYKRGWIYQELNQLSGRDRDTLINVLRRLNAAAQHSQHSR